MSIYWDDRFRQEGMIWGDIPSQTTAWATEWFERYQVHSVLVPGAGYGRNTKALSSVFHVDAIELSPEAAALGREWDPKTRFIQGSVLDMPLGSQCYDGIYAYDVLHLFILEDRERMISSCRKHLKPAGLLYFTVFSDQDENCGRGREIEPGTYEYKADKYAHFFTDMDLREHFKGMDILETGSFPELLNYLDGTSHTYHLRYIVAQKSIRT
ncbi:MAG: class I SAM-dependent methyltransferase [Gorillibacterium sp.]|nr:class I SAM-dependent methyltransferase [Gorillibacterium sp.]